MWLAAGGFKPPDPRGIFGEGKGEDKQPDQYLTNLERLVGRLTSHFSGSPQESSLLKPPPKPLPPFRAHWL